MTDKPNREVCAHVQSSRSDAFQISYTHAVGPYLGFAYPGVNSRPLIHSQNIRSTYQTLVVNGSACLTVLFGYIQSKARSTPRELWIALGVTRSHSVARWDQSGGFCLRFARSGSSVSYRRDIVCDRVAGTLLGAIM